MIWGPLKAGTNFEIKSKTEMNQLNFYIDTQMAPACQDWTVLFPPAEDEPQLLKPLIEAESPSITKSHSVSSEEETIVSEEEAISQFISSVHEGCLNNFVADLLEQVDSFEGSRIISKKVTHRKRKSQAQIQMLQDELARNP